MNKLPHTVVKPARFCQTRNLGFTRSWYTPLMNIRVNTLPLSLRQAALQNVRVQVLSPHPSTPTGPSANCHPSNLQAALPSAFPLPTPIPLPPMTPTPCTTVPLEFASSHGGLYDKSLHSAKQYSRHIPRSYSSKCVVKPFITHSGDASIVCRNPRRKARNLAPAQSVGSTLTFLSRLLQK
jgi:hypothetical protein